MIIRYGIRLLVLAGLGLGFVTGCGSTGTTGSSAITSTNPVVQGDALQIGGAVGVESSSASHRVQNGDRIIVGPGDGATLTFFDESTIFLQAGTETVVNLPANSPSIVNLIKGTVRAQGTPKAFGLQISDASVMPSASYSIFTVYNTDSHKAVDVTSGAVELRVDNGTSERVTAGKSTDLSGVPAATTVQAVAEATTAPEATVVPTTVPEATVAPTSAPAATIAPTTASEATVVSTTAPAATAVPAAATEVPATPAATATTNDNSVSLRSGPNTNTAILVRLDKGTQVNVIGEQNDWVQVRLADGREGWIFGRFLTR